MFSFKHENKSCRILGAQSHKLAVQTLRRLPSETQQLAAPLCNPGDSLVQHIVRLVQVHSRRVEVAAGLLLAADDVLNQEPVELRRVG